MQFITCSIAKYFVFDEYQILHFSLCFTYVVVVKLESLLFVCFFFKKKRSQSISIFFFKKTETKLNKVYFFVKKTTGLNYNRCLCFVQLQMTSLHLSLLFDSWFIQSKLILEHHELFVFPIFNFNLTTYCLLLLF